MNEVMLSIYVTTYNHEKYVAKALYSILMQQTKYSYEVLVGDDLSPDGTMAILQKYEKEYPGKFQMFYRKSNMFGHIPDNASDLIKRCSGKYIIALEGDDYWIDNRKIDKQIEFLESHPEFIAVAHNCQVVDQDSKLLDENYPECKELQYTFRHYASQIMPGQLTTLMYRNIYKNESINTDILMKGLVPGDQLLYFVLTSYGNIYCMQEKMSAYRHVKDQGTSFSATYSYNFQKEEYWYRSLLEYSKQIDNREAEKYAEFKYIRIMLWSYKNGYYSIKDLFQYIKHVNHIIRTLALWIKYEINKEVLHRKLWI